MQISIGDSSASTLRLCLQQVGPAPIASNHFRFAFVSIRIFIGFQTKNQKEIMKSLSWRDEKKMVTNGDTIWSSAFYLNKEKKKTHTKIETRLTDFR